jgi:hypothetical protein
MHFEELHNGVEEIVATIRNHDDDKFDEVAAKSVLIFGQTFISIAESLHDIAAVAKNWQDARNEPGEGPVDPESTLRPTIKPLEPLPSTFDGPGGDR